MQLTRIGDFEIHRIAEYEGPFIAPQDFFPDFDPEVVRSNAEHLGPRLIDPATAKIYPFPEAARNLVFLCVFADPWRVEFGPLVSELEAFRRPGMLLMLFPQGRRPDREVQGQLLAMKWTAPFVFDHLSEPYTKTLLSPEIPLPAVQLQTGEGRVLYEGRWSSAALREIDAALGRATAAAAK